MSSDTRNQQSKELRFAMDITRQAGLLAMRHYENAGARAGKMKPDNTPVTIADEQCERLIRQAIADTFPDDAIIGEEEGESEATTGKRSSGRRWIIDPIDGTYNFTRHIPVWSVLLALEENERTIVGVVNAPANNEIFYAERGGGAYRNDERLQVSAINSIAESQFEFGAPSRLRHQGFWDGLGHIVEATYRQRCYGDYVNFAHVFAGQAEAALEVGLKPWDIAPMQIIVEEAGGRFSDLEGKPSIYSGSCLVSNGLVHDRLLTLLHGR